MLGINESLKLTSPFCYRLRRKDEVALLKLIEPFNNLNEYIERLDEFRWTYAGNEDT